MKHKQVWAATLVAVIAVAVSVVISTSTDESVPPPPCQPATCQSLSAECGLQSDGCSGTLSCGACSSGQRCLSGVCIAESEPPLPGAPPDGDYDHVVTLTGSQTGSSVVATINALGAGSVLVRPLHESGATITGGMSIPRANVTLYGLNLTGEFDFDDGTVMWGVNAEPAMFGAGTKDNWVIRDSSWSGGAGETRANGCVGNVYAQNFFSGTVHNPTDNWTIENSTFKNYVPTESGCGVDHSEAFFIGARSTNGIIRNNVFTNNGNTAHIFFTWFGAGCTDYAPICSPDNICVEGNSFGQTWTGVSPPGAYYDINARYELSSSLNIFIDPAQGASLAGFPEWSRACPRDGEARSSPESPAAEDDDIGGE